MHRGCSIFPVAKKITPSLKKHLEKLVPLNGFREFTFTESGRLPQLIEARNIQAIATADSRLDEKSLAAYKEFNEGQKLVVLRPLLLCPASGGRLLFQKSV